MSGSDSGRHAKEASVKRHLGWIAALAVSLAAGRAYCWQGSPEQVYSALKADIPNLLCIDQLHATGGQPADAAWAKLAALGFRAVINLRTEEEGADLDAEKAAVEKSGMRYIGIPVAAKAPQASELIEFLKAVNDPSNRPVLIHCGSGNRVGAFWLVHRVLDDGWTEGAARQEAEVIGLQSPELKKFAHEQVLLRRSEIHW
jgi:uncharacterized protein (TIGR01244 family)